MTNLECNEKLQAKLRKLHALAQRGVGGERDTAQRMLDKLLAKHGLTLDDLLDEQRAHHWYTCSNRYEQRLALQIAAMILDTRNPSLFYKRNNARQFAAKLTKSEIIEFELHYQTLREALKAHLDVAFCAFVQANDIFPATPSSDRDDALSEHDLRVQKMASVTPATPVHARLEAQKSTGAQL